MNHRSRLAFCIFAAAAAAGTLALPETAPAQETAFQHYEKSKTLRAQGNLAAAVQELEAAHRLEPNNAVIAFDLAYALQAAGRNSEAADAFAAALTLDPSQFRIVEDRAYALKAAGRKTEAAAEFRKVIDNADLYPHANDADTRMRDERMERVRREIGYLERDWYANGYFVYRSNVSGGVWSPSVDNSFAASMAGFEAGWQPFDAARLQAFARGFFAFEPDSLDYNGRSLQFGIGLHWQPFAEENFVLTGERLIKAGDDARDGWLLRASYNWNIVRDDFLYTNVYADIAYIPGDNHYFSLYGEATAGWRFKIAPDWSLTPHVMLAATRTEDVYATRHLIEGGPGLMLTRVYGGDTYHAPMSSVSLSVQYRTVLDDNVGADDAWIVKLIWGL